MGGLGGSQTNLAIRKLIVDVGSILYVSHTWYRPNGETVTLGLPAIYGDHWFLICIDVYAPTVYIISAPDRGWGRVRHDQQFTANATGTGWTQTS